MATVDASRVFDLLGAKGLDIDGDYQHREDAARQRGPSRWPACLAPA